MVALQLLEKFYHWNYPEIRYHQSMVHFKWKAKSFTVKASKQINKFYC